MKLEFECVGCGRPNEVVLPTAEVTAAAAKGLGTSRVAARICVALWKGGLTRITAKEAAAVLRKDESHTACQWARRWLTKLEQEGLVVQELVASDGREGGSRGRFSVWSLTVAGIEVAEQCH